MRVVLWSEGMEHATGRAAEDQMLTEMPFITDETGAQCLHAVEQALRGPHDAATPLIFHIATSTRPCLLTMSASRVDAFSERFVLVQGREQLSLAANSGAVASSVTSGLDSDRSSFDLRRLYVDWANYELLVHSGWHAAETVISRAGDPHDLQLALHSAPRANVNQAGPHGMVRTGGSFLLSARWGWVAPGGSLSCQSLSFDVSFARDADAVSSARRRQLEL